MIFPAIITGLCLLVYWPALFHYVRSDLWLLHANTMGYTGLLDLMAGTISYTRSTLIFPQDIFVFRPLGNIYLSLEKYFFGFNFFLWQAAGILYHLVLVIFVFFFIARLIDSRVLAFLFSLFLLFLPAGFELVIWNYHIVFIVLLGSLGLASLLIDIDRDKCNFRIFNLILFSLIPFIHELGVIALAAFAVALFAHGKKYARFAIFSLTVIFMFIILNIADYRAHAPYVRAVFSLTTEWNRALLVFDPVYLLGVFFGTLKLIFSWIFIPLCPSLFSTVASHRVYLFFDINASKAFFMAVNALVLFFTAHIFLKAASWSAVRRNVSLLIFSLFSLFLLAFITYVGRVVTRGWDYILTINTYYYYSAWVFILMAVFACIDREKLGKINISMKYQAALLFIMFLFFCAKDIYWINIRYNQIFFEHKRFKSSVDNFIFKHKNEKDFNFIFRNRYTYDILVPVSVLRCDKSFTGCTLEKRFIPSSFIMFYPYCLGGLACRDNVKYILQYDIAGGLMAIPASSGVSP